MIFYEKDLDRHGDLKSSFLQIVPSKITQFVDRMAERVSMSLLNGCVAKITDATDAASGLIIVDHPENFTIGEKVTIDDDNSSPSDTCYVTAINMATKTLTISDARSAGSAVNLSAYTVAQNAKVYLPNGDDSGFTSLRSSLLSSTNGGGSTLYGQTKTSYPFLQAQQIDGSGMTANNVMETVYDGFFDTMAMGKGNPTEIVMSYKHFKNASKQLEVNRQFAVSDKKAGYGFRSISVVGNDGEMTITGVRDMLDSEIFIMDWDGLKFHGNNFFERKRHFNGDEFFLERATSGYKYVVDVKFFGDLIVNKPSHFGVIHSISYT
jgi:hypothetical protein